MKEGWKYRDFEKCLVKVPKQKAVKSKNYLDDGLFPIVSQESSLISGYTNDESLLYKHDYPVVIFGDHTKNVKYVDFDFVVGADGVHILSVVDDLKPKFFYYELCSIKLRNLGYARHYKLLKESQIKYPSLPEQQKIVDFLDTEFAKIDALKANAEQQLQAAKDLFQAALKDLLTPKEGWEEKTIENCVSKLVDGSHNPPKGVSRSQYKMLSSKNIGNNQLQSIDDVRYLSEADFITENKRTRAQSNDVALTIVGTIGRSYVLTEKDLPVTFQRSVAVMTPKDFLYPRFLMYSLTSINDLLNTKAHGAAQKGIYLNQLKKITIAIPSLPEQQQIAAQLDAISEKVQQLQSNYTQTLTLCNDLKQALLKSIFA